MATGRVPTTANSPLTAKGDLFTYSTAPARLAVGNSGEQIVANSAASTGLSYVALFGANKNKIINGDFYVNQRAFTSTTTSTTYGFDRWALECTGGTATYSTQAFTAGAAPVAGYEGTNYAQLVTASQSATGDYASIFQRIEDVRTFAAQTVTVSFWAKAATGTPNIGVGLFQSFGSGGSAVVRINGGLSAITNSWARYSFTVAIPSISGKTIGAGSYLNLYLFTSAGTSISGLGYPAVGVQNITCGIWGVQVEAGSVATAFQTATGTIQGELAACQRYYWRTGGVQYGSLLTAGNGYTATLLVPYSTFPQTMRIAPTSVDYNDVMGTDGVTNADVSLLTMYYATRNSANFVATTTGATAYRYYTLIAKTTAGYLGFSAEL